MSEADFEDVLRFWFPKHLVADHAAMVSQFEWWFRGGADAAIAERFTAVLERAARGDLDHWSHSPRSRLALTIVLDQFSRSIYRGTARAFAQDPQALTFFFLPLGHSEELPAPVAAALAPGEPARDGGAGDAPSGLAGRSARDRLCRSLRQGHDRDARAAMLPAGTELEVAGVRVTRARTFSNAPPGSLLWYANANGLAEIAANGASAAARARTRAGRPGDGAPARLTVVTSTLPAYVGRIRGASPSGKAPDFGSGIRRFKSCRPSQPPTASILASDRVLAWRARSGSGERSETPGKQRPAAVLRHGDHLPRARDPARARRPGYRRNAPAPPCRPRASSRYSGGRRRWPARCPCGRARARGRRIFTAAAGSGAPGLAIRPRAPAPAAG